MLSQNYVIQFILEKGSNEDRGLVIDRLHGHMIPMSKHKFASNVCEKALSNANADQRKQLIEEIVLHRSDGMNPIVTMIKDQYASMFELFFAISLAYHLPRLRSPTSLTGGTRRTLDHSGRSCSTATIDHAAVYKSFWQTH